MSNIDFLITMIYYKNTWYSKTDIHHSFKINTDYTFLYFEL